MPTNLWSVVMLLIMAFAYSATVENHCDVDEELESQLATSKFSLVVYINNANCSCIFDRENYWISDGMWTKMPPEEIYPKECVTFGLQSFAGSNDVVSASFKYRCGRHIFGGNWGLLPYQGKAMTFSTDVDTRPWIKDFDHGYLNFTLSCRDL